MRVNIKPVFSPDMINQSLEIMAPAWPLQNTVAVNPFWFLRHEKFDIALQNLQPLLHSSLYMPMNYYLDAYQRGGITAAAVAQALESTKSSSKPAFKNVEAFIDSCNTEELPLRKIRCLTEVFDESNHFSQRVIDEVGKYCAAYLDNRQSIAIFPWHDQDFWSAWIEAQQVDLSLKLGGLFDLSPVLKDLKAKSPKEAIFYMLERMNISSSRACVLYLQRLMASCMGWASQFRYAEWQRSLGYSVETRAATEDLLAVRLAYDFGFFCSKKLDANRFKQWQNSFQFDEGEHLVAQKRFEKLSILQKAWEISYQSTIASKITSLSQESPKDPQVQLAFCIDVRSEMIRRNIEREDPNLQTIGFAGFFGLPFDYQPVDEEAPRHQLPVLLAPSFKVSEDSQSGGERKMDRRLIRLEILKTFRALRKNPLSSFIYVKLFGILYLEKAIRRSVLSLWKKWMGRKIPNRFDPNGSALKSNLEVHQKVQLAEGILRHLGLTEKFARLVILVGHGSLTTNNAFASSLDCGACGGHAGDVNARYLVSLLNDERVRRALLLNGIEIPATTHFVSALHETVTDEIYILEPEIQSLEVRPSLLKIQDCLRRASKRTSAERLQARSNRLDPRAERRAYNWSETRPEWGLAGNACFIVAPRRRTRGIDLASRSFLHDYDWRKDQAQGYKTLELIMTAPMIVTNWINLQYYASTVAPSVYGSGNKVIHNLTNESGVVEGNGGDLRIGLPLQSVHDGNRFVHEPLRLSVFIEAPREEIERIIERHEVVRQLVDNEWLHVLQIDSEDLAIYRRAAGGQYTPVVSKPL